MNHTRLLTIAAATAALSAAFAAAQSKPAEPAKPAAAAVQTAKPAAPTPAAPAATKPPVGTPPSAQAQKPECACPGCAAEHAGTKGMDCPMAKAKGQDECPMLQAVTLADIKVETTAGGAAIQLVAKNAADVPKVQALARELREHLANPHAHGGMHKHDDEHRHGPH